MSRYYNIYCDESNHMLAGAGTHMVLGGVMCPASEKEEIFQRIKAIKKENELGHAEMKWSRVARGKIGAYRDLINFFFDKESLRFRSVVIEKQQIDLQKFEFTYDDFYYRMYFRLLEWFIATGNHYSIYLDIKDTQGVEKVSELHKVLCNAQLDFDLESITRIQEVRSHEIALMQLVDILIGAVGYANKYPQGGESGAKNEIVELIRKRSDCSLVRSTSLGSLKFNIFQWEGR